MYTTPCDAGQTLSGGSCTDTRQSMTYNNGTDTWTDTGYTSTVTGYANTQGLVALVDGGAPYQAAAYCAGLTAGGHSDWYLPAKDELNVMYTNRTAIGGFETVNLVWYWSSTEDDSSHGWIQLFSGVSQLSRLKYVNRYVRCIRR